MADKAAAQSNSGVDANLARHGKVAYMRIPAADTATAAAFYRDVFGWSIVSDNPDHRSFADASGDMIGAFVTGLPPSSPGVLPYIYVDGIDAVVAAITTHGGEIVEPAYAEGGLWVATFKDPTGNVLGIWQAGPR